MLERRNGSTYYYRYRKRNGRSERLYVASGPAAVAFATLDGLGRERREAERLRRREERERIEAEDRAAEGAFRGVLTVVCGVLERSGYRRHARGHWRRQKGARMSSELARMSAAEAKEIGRFKEWADRTRSLAIKGDKSAALKLRDSFASPAEHVAHAGWTVAELAKVNKAARFCGEDNPDAEMVAIDVEAQHDAVRDALAGPSPSPTVGLLAEVAASTWLSFWRADLTAGTDPSIAENRALDRAHRRLTRSLRVLADVKRIEASMLRAAPTTPDPTPVLPRGDGRRGTITVTVRKPTPDDD